MRERGSATPVRERHARAGHHPGPGVRRRDKFVDRTAAQQQRHETEKAKEVHCKCGGSCRGALRTIGPLSTDHARAQADFYKGKTVDLMIGYLDVRYKKR